MTDSFVRQQRLAAARAVVALGTALRGRAVPVGLRRFAIDAFNDVTPDVALLDPSTADDATGTRGLLAAIEYGRDDVPVNRARLYARAGVPDYVFVDLAGDLVVHHAQPHPAGYAEVVYLRRGERLTFTALDDRSFDATLFL